MFNLRTLGDASNDESRNGLEGVTKPTQYHFIPWRHDKEHGKDKPEE
jgi:hypothetical protein